MCVGYLLFASNVKMGKVIFKYIAILIEIVHFRFGSDFRSTKKKRRRNF